MISLLNSMKKLLLKMIKVNSILITFLQVFSFYYLQISEYFYLSSAGNHSLPLDFCLFNDFTLVKLSFFHLLLCFLFELFLATSIIQVFLFFALVAEGIFCLFLLNCFSFLFLLLIKRLLKFILFIFFIQEIFFNLQKIDLHHDTLLLNLVIHIHYYFVICFMIPLLTF